MIHSFFENWLTPVSLSLSGKEPSSIDKFIVFAIYGKRISTVDFQILTNISLLRVALQPFKFIISFITIFCDKLNPGSVNLVGRKGGNFTNFPPVSVPLITQKR